MNDTSQAQKAVPAVWYNLAARISSVRAVVSFITEALPVSTCCMNELQITAINRTGALAGAADDLLELVEKDVETLGMELQGIKVPHPQATTNNAG